MAQILNRETSHEEDGAARLLIAKRGVRQTIVAADLVDAALTRSWLNTPTDCEHDDQTCSQENQRSRLRNGGDRRKLAEHEL